MADGTGIEWATTTWSPITGCDPDDGYQSAACDYCWARRMSKRLAGRFGYPADDPFRVTLHPDRLDQPLRWRKPRRVFVCSMGDLFHEDVPFEEIVKVFGIIADCYLHTFLVLTKRPERMAAFFKWFGYFGGSYGGGSGPLTKALPACFAFRGQQFTPKSDQRRMIDPGWPLPNLWLGVTAENQARADERIPILLQIPAVMRFVSVEPCLEEMLLDTIVWHDESHVGLLTGTRYIPRSNQMIEQGGIDWIICGAETGPGARPMSLDWARSLRDQCQAAGVSFFFKRDSDGNRTLDGVMWEQYPETAAQCYVP